MAIPMAWAEDWIQVREDRPESALWFNPGMLSYHFQRDKGFDNRNLGAGVEYRLSTTMSLTAGQFNNSDHRSSRYLGGYWQPLALGPFALGAALGFFDGYPAMRDGGWFPALIPAMTYEGQRFGANLLFVPNYGDRLHGALSLQLKLRVW